MVLFPSDEWTKEIMEVVNNDEECARIAKNFEGDFYYIVTPDGGLKEKTVMYFDYWHGKCRNAYLVEDVNNHKAPAYRITAKLSTFHAMFEKRLDFMKATLTRKVKVKGNMMKMMKDKKVADRITELLQSVPIKLPE